MSDMRCEECCSPIGTPEKFCRKCGARLPEKGGSETGRGWWLAWLVALLAVAAMLKAIVW